jgi:regulator of nonsense transcripts 2
MKYLGELYMYRVISTPIVFETLWLLVSYGHGELSRAFTADKWLMEISVAADGLPVPGRSSPIDTPDDFFRVRLVCTLLDTCGACFDKGSNKKKLDHFLTVFQVSLVRRRGAGSRGLSGISTALRSL